MKKITFQPLYFFITIVFIILEIFIALYVHDSFVRPVFGDFIVVAVLYSFVRIWVKKPSTYLALYVFIFAGMVEISQYFRLIELLHLEQYTFLRILLGTTFDIQDIVAYATGCALLYIYQHYIEKNIKR